MVNVENPANFDNLSKLFLISRDCLSGQVEHSGEAAVKCPFQDDKYNCDAIVQDREIRAVSINT